MYLLYSNFCFAYILDLAVCTYYSKKMFFWCSVLLAV